MFNFTKRICAIALVVLTLSACTSSLPTAPVTTTTNMTKTVTPSNGEAPYPPAGNNYVDDLAVTQDGIVWLFIHGRLLLWDPALVRTVALIQWDPDADSPMINADSSVISADLASAASLPDKKSIALVRLAPAADGSLWVASTPPGASGHLKIYHFDGRVWHYMNPNFDIPTPRTPHGAMSTGLNGSLWMVMGREGIVYFDGQEWHRLPFEQETYTVAQATDGSVWAGAICMRVFRYQSGTWTNYGLPQFHDCTFELGNLGVLTLAAAPDNAVWIGTRDGVRRFKDGGFDSFTQKHEGLPSDSVSSIAVTPDNQVWVGTDQGIAHFDGRLWHTYTTADGLAGNIIRVVRVAPDGTIWAGTDQGFSHFDGQHWQSYKIYE